MHYCKGTVVLSSVPFTMARLASSFLAKGAWDGQALILPFTAPVLHSGPMSICRHREQLLEAQHELLSFVIVL